MAHLPLLIDLQGTRCAVVGAGRLAERKIATLVRAGARVRVIAPRATMRIRALARRGVVGWRRTGYRPGDLKGTKLVVAATSDPATNRMVARHARRLGIFCNVGDDGLRPGTALMPAVFRRGPLVVAVSTSGESPAIARLVRDRVAARFGREYAGYVRIVGAARRRLLAEVADERERARRYRRVLRLPLLRLLRTGRLAEARRAARAACSAG